MANRPQDYDAKVLTIADLALEAQKRLPPVVRDYFNEGAGELITLKDNESAYNRYKLIPRVLRDVDTLDTSTTIFGQKIRFPFGFAPAAAHKLAHADGESATSRAAGKNNIPMCLSSWATTGIEEVISNGSGNPYAMQVSFFRDVEITRRIIKKAEEAGYKALFVSVDLPVLGNRLNESRNNFNFPSDMRFPVLADGIEELGLKSTYERGYDPTIRWDKTIAWLRQNTKLEIWLKGVYSPDDVQLAIDHKVDGIIISNHGGRQLDGVPATLDALRICAPVARGKIPLAIDGGIRRGADVFKALALGASMCFVGRIPIWGLAYNGEKGVDLAIKIIYDEFCRTMKLTGCRTIADITPSHLGILETNGLLAKL
ncbi:FMN-dependent dehydrogenase family protein [Aspergillus sclerotioniger CBS 115572]|uniref:Oxidase FUB9 n=1 Tax=Aspergillus sclerotioniger CBS 115572 TaxID=1450535 RepID=A0A317X5Z6_9EURO|nr:FMN-dependent dehydrogenase family protein [Aspergillus sclerotioniger CBS 115572]PWY92977.1 FMN-dependent dehydrogenase family protein [Aspergillus sclerotioniger CBS 115572]